MIGLLIGLGALAAFRTQDTGIFIPAVINALGSFWSNGVLANYRNQPLAAPGWAAIVSMLTAALAVVFIVLSFFIA